jgi:hypothetical protein
MQSCAEGFHSGVKGLIRRWDKPEELGNILAYYVVISLSRNDYIFMKCKGLR